MAEQDNPLDKTADPELPGGDPPGEKPVHKAGIADPNVLNANFADTDVLVVGGGPAGLAAGIAARRKGFRVVVADATHPPVDKACGEGLMPEALDALAELDIELPAGSGRPFRGISFMTDDVSVWADFPGMTSSREASHGPPFPGGAAKRDLKSAGLGIRRTALHQALVCAAETAGIALLWDSPVTALTPNGALFGDQHISCRWLIGADGSQSRIRHWAGINSRESSVRYGFRRHYRKAPWSDYVEVYWAPSLQVYVAAVGAEEVCVALLARDQHIRLDDALESFPELLDRLDGAEHLSQERGGISAMRRVAAVTQGRIALVGDASGSVDAITGQGLCLGFQQALALADALANEDLSFYESAHRRIMHRPRVMANLLLQLDRHPALRAVVFRQLADHPRVFEWLLAYHVGAVAKTAASLRSAIKAQWKPGHAR